MLQNRSTRIIADIRCDFKSGSPSKNLVLKTILGIFDEELRLVTHQSISELAPLYLCTLATKNCLQLALLGVHP